jgi:two-component system response regulator LytT
MVLHAIVVDDEPLARDELVFLLAEAGGVEVAGTARNAAEALALAERETPDVAFVDLRMPGPDGVALAEALLARRPELAVVVVSAHDDGALRAFEARVLDYLLKPVRLARLQKTLERVRDAAPGTATSASPAALRKPGDPPLARLAVRRRGVYVVLDIADVVCFEMKDELVWAVTATDRFALDLTLAAVEQAVDERAFFRSHRGVLVCLDRIAAIEPAGAGTFELVLDHPEQLRVPLARERARLLRERIPFTG